MAIDPFFAARQFQPSALRDASRLVSRHGHAAISNGETKLTLFPSAPSPSRDHKQSTLDSTDAYELLARLGLVAVAGAPTDGVLPLKGGSVSTCDLVLDNTLARVRKRVRHSVLPALDSVERHRAEALWIVDLQREGPGHLFPRVESIEQCADGVTITSCFLGCFTLGEWMLQRAHAQQPQDLEGTARQVFELLKQELYTRPVLEPTSTESYIQKAQRRLRLIYNEARIGNLVASMWARGATVNGIRCRPLGEQLELLTSTSVGIPLNPAEFFSCHGDLIPEDILVDGSGSIVAFVDPNPQNCDPLVDVGKFVMSACTGYDLALRDWLSVSVSSTSLAGGYEITTSWPTTWKNFVMQQSDLGIALSENATDLLPGSLENRCRLKGTALIMAGLQAICIAPFHLLHHDRPERALHFIASGHRLIEQGLSRNWQ